MSVFWKLISHYDWSVVIDAKHVLWFINDELMIRRRRLVVVPIFVYIKLIETLISHSYFPCISKLQLWLTLRTDIKSFGAKKNQDKRNETSKNIELELEGIVFIFYIKRTYENQITTKLVSFQVEAFSTFVSYNYPIGEIFPHRV